MTARRLEVCPGIFILYTASCIFFKKPAALTIERSAKCAHGIQAG
jgi:hypothetical protein